MKTLTTLALALVATMGLGAGCSSPETSQDTSDQTATALGINLALNKPVVASSVEDVGLEASKAVDGNLGTRWSSAYADPQWIYVDLGATYDINEVKLSWETAYAKAYSIQVSADAQTWTTIYSTSTGDGGTDDLTGLSGRGRYVRVYATTRGTAWGDSLWEFEVYGADTTGGGTSTTPPLFVNGQVASSAYTRSLTVAKPTGSAAGQVLIAAVAAGDTTAKTPTSITPPPGFTLIKRTDHRAQHALATYYHVVTSSEPASYTFGFSTNVGGNAWIGAYSGLSTASLVDVVAGQDVATGGTTVAAPSVTTSQSNDLVLALVTGSTKPHSWSTSWSTPAGTSERVDVWSGDDNSVAVFDRVQPGAAPTGAATSVASVAQTFAIAQTLALRGATTTSSGDTTAPSVAITSPASGSTYTSPQSVTIAATASDNVGVAKVEFYEDGTLRGTSAAAPYGYVWSLSSADNGSHVWTAKAFDAAGNNASSNAVTLSVDITGSVDPVIAAAGDIACVPGGTGVTSECHQGKTSDILVNGGFSAILTLGDNQYDSGTLSEYQNSFNPSWGRVLSLLKPVPGNHEYYTSNAQGYFGYFGTRAGDPSKGYYSYDVGAWHLIALNSNDDCTVLGCGAGSPQEQWLRADLAANAGKKCTLAYWHHPLFSSGQYGTDLAVQALWQALYDYNAEIVLVGHEHHYERFAPQTPGGSADPARGIREFIVGTGGRSLRATTHVAANSEVRHDTTFGVLKIVLHATSYDFQFMPEAGATWTDSGSTNCH